MREVEVLHDQLLDLFERDPDLRPRDVVVMSPAIDVYVPFVEAVFGGRSGREGTRIPYQLADRTLRASEEVVEIFARILSLLGGRLGAADVLDLLAVAPVRGRFGIEAEDLELIREWVRESGTRWGVDERHRGEMGQPAIRANTWRFGLDRLLLAYAMHGDDRMLFAGVLPCDRVEGQGDLLGRVVGFCDRLFTLRERVVRPLLLPAWGDLCDEILESMVECTSLNRDQHQRIREGARELVEEAARSGFEEVVSLEVLRGRLDGRFAERRSTGSFLARGVTFCALVPMRSIPFRVVCLLGMKRRRVSAEGAARGVRRARARTPAWGSFASRRRPLSLSRVDPLGTGAASDHIRRPPDPRRCRDSPFGSGERAD